MVSKRALLLEYPDKYQSVPCLIVGNQIAFLHIARRKRLKRFFTNGFAVTSG